MDELSQLDELIESDILEALGQSSSEQKEQINEDAIIIEDLNEVPNIENEIDESSVTIENFEEDNSLKNTISTEETVESHAENLQINSTLNTNDLASLLSQLLHNKTIEITIKIKD